MPLLVGADPEIFVKKGSAYISAHGMIPGTKKKPFKVELGAIQVDGTALEVNIKPATSPDEFVYNIHHVINQLRMRIPKDCEFAREATVEFDLEHMMAQPSVALERGCDPDYNAYTLEINPPPPHHNTKRSAGGHIHIGYCKGMMPYDPVHFEGCARVARQLDYYNGLIATILDKDEERKQWYGKAGAYRPKSYGMEYRTPSNYWLWDDNLMRLNYENATVAYNNLMAGRDLYQEYGDTARKIIDNNDRDEAIRFCEEIGIPISMQ